MPASRGGRYGNKSTTETSITVADVRSFEETFLENEGNFAENRVMNETKTTKFALSGYDEISNHVGREMLIR